MGPPPARPARAAARLAALAFRAPGLGGLGGGLRLLLPDLSLRSGLLPAANSRAVSAPALTMYHILRHLPLIGLTLTAEVPGLSRRAEALQLNEEAFGSYTLAKAGISLHRDDQMDVVGQLRTACMVVVEATSRDRHAMLHDCLAGMRRCW